MYKIIRIKDLIVALIEIIILNSLVILFVILSKVKRKSFFFVQIGANDGKSGDPLYHLINFLNLKGVLYEPVPYIFDKLKSNYNKNKNVFLENKAITPFKKTLPFYYLKENDFQGMPKYFNQLGSFNLEILMKNKIYIPNFDLLLTKELVKTTNFEELIDKFKISNIDLIFIDAEGYDYEILKIIPFHKINPSIIIYEHTHLSEKDLDESINLLKEKRYFKIKNKGDFVFIKF